MNANATIANRPSTTAVIPPAQSRLLSAVSNGDVQRFRLALLRWYDLNRRDLPWRQTRDPYRIWLSEIMLQQTRVAAVLEHYRMFLQRFPGIDALANASEEAVLAAWSGLGYYRRARMMHQCAQRIVEQFGGSMPRDSATLRALPGIGRYTAAAIASISFGEPSAVVDGNVARVLRRFDGRNLSIAETWRAAKELLDRSRPGDFNQAMMELGATACLPRVPLCQSCPVRKYCATRGFGTRKSPATPQKKREIWCIFECRATDGKVRLIQRPRTESMMPGMWELPLRAEAPLNLRPAGHWKTLRHSITVTNYTVHVLRNPTAKMRERRSDGKWISLARLSEIPITGLTRKILKAGGLL